MATIANHFLFLMMLDGDLQIEMVTEKVRRLVAPKGLAAMCETPPDISAIDAAHVMVGGEWVHAPTRTRTVHYMRMNSADGIPMTVEIPDGYTLLQRQIHIGDTPYTQYGFVSTVVYQSMIDTPPPDTTTT